ncbi:MAG: tetraacyldisaccharide 4'-kinase [Deltaproteobacteria bacterium]|nr:tetraacyldisaccharide 4'-kinase [Deltaproteobacteria bacterium]
MWFDEGEQSRWRAAARLALAPASVLFGAGALLQRALYQHGALQRRALSIRVISVGSLVAGCSGATLTAAWVANELRHRGHRVALAASAAGGSRRRREAVHVVSDGQFVKSRVEIAGASAMILAAHSPGIPVLIGADRFQVGARAASAFGTEVLVLDDGIRCHSLARDADIFAIDGQSGFGNRWPFPCGPLREPAWALHRAGALGVIDGPLNPKDQAVLQRYGSAAFRFVAQRRPVAIRPLRGGAAESPEVLEGAAVGLISGLTQPTSLRNTVEQLGAKVVTERSFRDHHRYGPKDMRYLYRNAPLWITTETDAIRINPEWIGRADVRVLSIKLECAQGGALLDWLEASLR